MTNEILPFKKIFLKNVNFCTLFKRVQIENIIQESEFQFYKRKKI